jgi:hypothetical protein
VLIIIYISFTHYRTIKADARSAPLLSANPGYTVSSLDVHQNKK